MDKGSYAAGARFELPLERTAEQNAYRSSLINLERAARAVQEFEDSIKQSVRNQLRSMLQSRESLKTQGTAVAVAERRVRSTQMLLDAGRAQLEAEVGYHLRWREYWRRWALNHPTLVYLGGIGLLHGRAGG